MTVSQPAAPSTAVRRAVVLVLGIAAAMFASAASAAASDGSRFDDVAGPHAEAIERLAHLDIVRGCSEDRFCPQDEVTRAQLASMLTVALGLRPVEDGPFTDTDGSVHEPQINAVHAVGITDGCGNGSFCPDEVVTRNQVASLLVDAFSVPEATRQHFDGASTIHGANVDRLAEAGIAAGCGDPLTSFCGGDPVTREQAVTFIARAMRLVPRVELPPLEERRAAQAEIDAQRAAEAARQAELEAELAAQREMERVAAQRLAMWERLAQCESNGNWSINTGNGFYGGLQFMLQTWRSVGGTGYPHHASKTEQIYRAERLLKKPWATFGNQWPACSRMLGLS